MEKYNFCIKVSKKGFNVIDSDEQLEPSDQPKKEIKTDYLRYTLALPYLVGAKNQIERYRKAAQKLQGSPTIGVIECIHETSTLFEDLSTLAKYATRHGHENMNHSLWFDVRNHIRHDTREEFDDESDKRKIDRARKLKLDLKLQTEICFSINSIKVGGIIITIKQIQDYLHWLEGVMADVLVDAKEKGYIKES